MFVFKILVFLLSLNSTLNSFGLPIFNEKFQILLVQLNETEASFFLVAFIICVLLTILTVRFLNIQNKIKN